MTDVQIPVLPRHPRSDYIGAPPAIAKRTSAGSRGWLPGWPAGVPHDQLTRVTVTRPQDGHEFGVNVDERLGELYGSFLAAIQDVGHPLIGALEKNVAGGMQGGIGSYFNRPIKGSNPPKPSNHSSGTALDLWTRSNVMRVGRFADGSYGRAVAFVSTIHPLAVEIAAAADLFWGGWYWDAKHPKTGQHYYVDAMHFEYMKRPADVAGSIERLKAKHAEIKKRLEPDVPVEPDPGDGDVDIEDVKLLQRQLNRLGATPQLVVDGDFGALTRAALEALPGRIETQISTAETTARADTKEEAKTAIDAIPTGEEGDPG